MSIETLDIEDKENHPDLVAFLEAFGPHLYLSAEEINQFRNKINQIISAINGGNLNSIHNDVTDSAVLTNTTQRTILKSKLMPANSIGKGVLTLDFVLSQTGSANVRTIFVYLSDSPTSTTGASIIAYMTTANNAAYIPINRKLRIKPGNILFAYNNGTSQESMDVNSAIQVPYDTTTDKYILFTVKQEDASDSTVINGVKITFEPEV